MSSSAQRFHLVYVFERFPTFTQTFCVREILELERQGVKPLLFSLRDTRDEPVQNYPEGLRDRVHYLPDSPALTRFVRQLRSDKQVPKPVDHTLRHWNGQPDKRRVYEAAYIGHRIRQIAPGLRHAHAHFAGMAARTLWWLRLFEGLSYSLTAHANDIFCAEPDSIASLNRIMQDASRIITVSDYTVDRLSRQYPGCGHKIRRVYNGLDLAQWTRAAGGSPAGIGSRRIVAVGRLIEKKGFDDLVRASAFLRDWNVPHTVHIVGGGPLEEALRRQIREAGLETTVFLEGERDQAWIMNLLAREAHLFALPCVTEKDGGMDNLPTVIMEAMAVGLPCVSTRLAGIPEMVLEEETGLLTAERNPEAFARALQRLLEDPALCRRFGEAGTRVAGERFDKQVTVRNLRRRLYAGGSVRAGLPLLRQHPDLVPPLMASLPGRLVRRIRGRPPFSAEKLLGGEA